MNQRRVLLRPNTARCRIHALLVMLVLFALLHVSLHGLPDANDNLDGGDCQICRLGNTPMGLGKTLAIPTPLFTHFALVELSNTQNPYSPRYVPWLARGPPYS